MCYDPSLTIPQSECFALRDFYTSTSGATWFSEGVNTSDDRFSTADVDVWYGVDVQSGHVAGLTLINNNLSGNLSNLSELTQLV